MSDILFDPNPSQASEAFQRACQHAADRLPEHVDHAAKLLPDLHEIYARALKLFTIAQLRFWHVDSSDEEDDPRPLFPSSGPCPSWTLDHPGPAPPALALVSASASPVLAQQPALTDLETDSESDSSVSTIPVYPPAKRFRSAP